MGVAVEEAVLGAEVVETGAGMAVEGQAVGLAQDVAVVADGFVEVRLCGAQGKDVGERARGQESAAPQLGDELAVWPVLQCYEELVIRPWLRGSSGPMDGRSRW